VRIGLISQWFAPEPAFIPTSLAAELAARGHEVRVLTGYPNYPDGRIYPGFRQRWGRQSTVDGYRLRRVPLYPSHDSSTLRRTASYASFAASSSLAALRYLRGVDVVYVYHPPATTFAAAAVLRRLRHVPAVVHIQDLWPDAVTDSSLAPRSRLFHSGLNRLMRHIYSAAAGIVVSAPSVRDTLVERGADPERVRLVLNWTDEALFHPVGPTDEGRAAIGHRGRCTIMHAGNIGPFQNVANAVQAAAAAADAVDLVLVGTGIEEDVSRRLAAELNATNVRFLGRRDPSLMAMLYGAAEFQLVSLRDRPCLRGAIPSKLQAALSCGSPVVAATGGDCGQLVEADGSGLTCPPDDWPSLAARFTEVASLAPPDRQAMGRQARRSYQIRMSQQAGVDALEAVLAKASR
jgi:glycosyltransferase involved in cell wall biosynthesis